MKSISVLDCTLRDGGYCNDCKFGFENEKTIVNGLIDANINIIECGFYRDSIKYDKERTRFTTLDEVAQIIPANRKGKTFVVLADYGRFDPNVLPEYDGTSVDGFRVAFHKKDRIAGLEACKIVKEKGYKVFVQPMVAVNYSDAEYLDLINGVNEIEPCAFYIVDSFGMMKKKDLTRLFYIVEHNLKETVKVGFHSHNNLQLAYSNATALTNIPSDRSLIIDSSIYGMGRGAGNLNTELFIQYLNDNFNGKFEIRPLLTLMDEIINNFYQMNPWGYSLPNYLSAEHVAHPNYAIYLDNKKTLTVSAMNEIFDRMDPEKKISYDKDYIEKLYLDYMETGKLNEEALGEIKEKIAGKKILVIAPGNSSKVEADKIIEFAKLDDVISISINFDYSYFKTDYIFLSNLRRYRELNPSNYSRCIVTSNVPSDHMLLQTDYKKLTNDVDAVRDNAGMMLIRFLLNLGCKDIYLAGIDGYSTDYDNNYVDERYTVVTPKAVLELMNSGIEKILEEYSKQANIQFLTQPRYVHINNRGKKS